jgi:multiple sugar transport system substrate-binding protein
MLKKFLTTITVALVGVTVVGRVYAANPLGLNTLGGPDPIGHTALQNQKFEQLTGIKVNVTTVPYSEQRTKLLVSFISGGSAYDMFIIDCIEIPEYAEAGWAYPIDQYVTPEMKKDLFPFAAEGVTYKGHWYGLPFASEWKSFVYNEAKLNAAGIKSPPKTWDELIAQSQLLQKKGLVKYGTAFSFFQGECLVCDYVAIAGTFGAKFFDENQNPVFNSGGGVEALQFMVDAIHKYKVVNPGSLNFIELDVDNAMLAGDIAFCLRWGLPLITMNDSRVSKVVRQCKIGLVPSKKGFPTATVSGPMGWAIAAGSKNKEAAIKYIFYRSDQAGAKRDAIAAGIVPGWASLYKDKEMLKAIPGIETMLEQGKYVINRPQVPWYNEFSTMFQVELQNALTLRKTPQQALNDAAQKARAIKAKYERQKR